MFIIVYPCCSYMYWTGTCLLFAQLLAQVSRTHSRAGATVRCPATEVQRLPGLGLVPIRCPFIPINFEVAGFNCHVSSSLSISMTFTRNAQLSKSKVQFPSPSSLSIPMTFTRIPQFWSNRFQLPCPAGATSAAIAGTLTCAKVATKNATSCTLDTASRLCQDRYSHFHLSSRCAVTAAAKSRSNRKIASSAWSAQTTICAPRVLSNEVSSTPSIPPGSTWDNDFAVDLLLRLSQSQNPDMRTGMSWDVIGCQRSNCIKSNCQFTVRLFWERSDSPFMTGIRQTTGLLLSILWKLRLSCAWGSSKEFRPDRFSFAWWRVVNSHQPQLVQQLSEAATPTTKTTRRGDYNSVCFQVCVLLCIVYNDIRTCIYIYIYTHSVCMCIYIYTL